jgi:hypothetical protein
VPEIGPAFFLSEIEVEDLFKDQLEGIRYRIKDYGTREFEILCEDVKLASDTATTD